MTVMNIILTTVIGDYIDNDDDDYIDGDNDEYFVLMTVIFLVQGIADVVEALLEDVDSYLDEASGKGANQQVSPLQLSYSIVDCFHGI